MHDGNAAAGPELRNASYVAGRDDVSSSAGNVRELANSIQRAVALSDADLLSIEDFEPAQVARAGTLADKIMDADMTLQQLERLYLKRVLQKTRGNKTLAAQILGLERRTVYRKVAELGIEKEEE